LLDHQPVSRSNGVGKLLGWRLGETETAAVARLAFADVVRDFGIPGHVYLDNGRAFASKNMTGGVATRFL
jgi:hypothetical protein